MNAEQKDKVKRMVDNAFTCASKDHRENDLSMEEYYNSLAGFLYRAMKSYGNQQWNAAVSKMAEKSAESYKLGWNAALDKVYSKKELTLTSGGDVLMVYADSILSLKHKDNE